ncbi:MAG: BrnT family toxin [Acidobacteriota bacterium]|nr:MAG: BrnT family toxin [Acidobacteriota bacterium]
MRFEWDEKKRQRNLKKHGIDFVDLELLYLGVTLTILDDRFNYEEDRFVTFGFMNGVVLVVAHTEENDVIRFISARKATRNEEKRYFEEIAD